jgi:hypothetical protein
LERNAVNGMLKTVPIRNILETLCTNQRGVGHAATEQSADKAIKRN